MLPNDWKSANIMPMYKRGPHDVAENYRTVYLTSVICKTMEHIVYSQIGEYLEMNNILTPCQHGFRRNYSSETQLVTAIDDWAKTIDQRQQTDIMTLDFSKAFDVVAHQGCYPSCRRTEFEASCILGWLVFLQIANNVLSSVVNYHNGFQC